MHDTHGTLRCGRFNFSLSRPLVMAILNVTPDSFSDGGQFHSRDAALRHAERLIADGADILDIGGESTRPGAPPLSLGEELDRVMPLVEALHDCGVAVSVDTYKPDVMRAVLDAGADMINDIRGFTEDGALEAIARSECAVCAMHMLGDPRTMQEAPMYDDVVAEVRAFLDRRVIALESAGVARERIVVDPGFGFGKNVAHNYRLLRDLPMTSPGGLPILVGMSRKSMLAAVLGDTARSVWESAIQPASQPASYPASQPASHPASHPASQPVSEHTSQTASQTASQAVPQPAPVSKPASQTPLSPAARLHGSIAAAICAAERGAAIIRVHDVAPTVEALAVWRAINANHGDAGNA